MNGRRATRALVVFGLALAGSCAGDDGAGSPSTSVTTSMPPVTSPPSTPPSTGATSTMFTSTTTFVAPTTTTTSPATAPPTPAPPPTGPDGETPTDPELLAGARVLCAFSGAEVPGSLLEQLHAGRAAGILLFAANLASAQQAQELTGAVQSAASRSPSGLRAIVATDQEGGRVARIPGPPSAPAEALGQLPPDQVRAEGAATAANLLAWGINVDLAPVADVARAGTFLDRQDRSFSSDPAVASAGVSAFVGGLHDGGVASTLKHFPGLGAADANTDLAAARVDIDPDTWWTVDALPFEAGIAAGTDLVMVSSAVYGAFDAVPAVLSPSIVDGLLRHDLGFGGVTISDALGTPALAPFGTLPDTAVAAAVAGVDLFISGDPAGCVDGQRALADAIRSGGLPLASAQASYGRIAALRAGLS